MARGCAAKNYNIEMYEEQINEYFESPRSLRRQFKEKAASGLGRTIGSVARAGKRVVPFDPNAIDGDGDFKVQDDSIWERPVGPGLLSRSKPSRQPRLSDDLFEKDLAGEAPRDGQIEAAELIDAAIFEQMQIALGEINPKQAEATRELTSSFETKPGKKKPSQIFVIKNALEKYNIEFGTDFDLESIILGLIDENPEYENSDLKIKGHFFASIKTKDKFSLKKHQSNQYKYGDRSALGGEIRATRSDWLDGLTPTQIASIIVPSNAEEAFEIYLDLIYGSDADFIRNSELDLELARSLFDINMNNVALEGVVDNDGNPKPIRTSVAYESEVEGIRASLISMLENNQEFFAAVQKLGIPPIIPMDMYSDGDPVIADKITKINGWYVGEVGFIGIPTENIFRLQGNDARVQTLVEKLKSGEEIRIAEQLNLVSRSTLEKTITHEWGHYLHHMARRLFRRENGVNNMSIMGQRMGFKKYNPVFKKLTDISLALTSPKRINNPNGGNLVVADQNVLASLEARRKVIMENAKEFSQMIFDIVSQLNRKEIDEETAKQMFKELMDFAKSGGIVSAPTKYGASSPQEQFAELISFFFGGSLFRNLLSPDAAELMKEAFSEILPKGFDELDANISSRGSKDGK